MISGNIGNGVNISGAGTSSNVVQGNYIGLNSAGTAALPNTNDGVAISSGATNNAIGGIVPGAGNVISGNQFGMSISGAGTTGNQVLGNVIGTNPAGTAAIGNVNHGLLINDNASANSIGGTTPAARNTISGNQNGVLIQNGAALNAFQGNHVGMNAAGTAAIPNTASGLVISNGAVNNTIGGTSAGAGNRIANNALAGVVVNGLTSTGNAILGNAIDGNGSLGIDLLGAGGVTPNDAGDARHRRQQPAELPGAVGCRGWRPGSAEQRRRTRRTGSSSSAMPRATPPATAKARRLLGVTSVTTDGTGNATIPLFAAATGQFVTATATDPLNNTSEFSACVQPTAAGLQADLALAMVDAPDPVVVGSPLTYGITVTNNGPSAATNVVVTDVLPPTVTLVSATSSLGTCTGTTTITCSLGIVPFQVVATVAITVTPTTSASLSNTATVVATEADPIPANNAATMTTSPSFVVTNTNDAGAGSLRQAILDANARTGADIISFAIPGGGVHTISPVSHAAHNLGAVRSTARRKACTSSS